MHVLSHIPVSGYTPGQTIDVEIDIDNRSGESGEFSLQLLKVRDDERSLISRECFKIDFFFENSKLNTRATAATRAPRPY